MTSDQPLVSIITPVHNGQKHLAELIESVREQDYPNIEHIIIDDGSTDDGATLAILAHYPHLRWWSRENRGQYATMNEGLEGAKGDLVCFASADDMVMPGAVGHVIEYLEQHAEYDGVVGLTQFVNEACTPYANAPFETTPVRYCAYLSQILHCSPYLKRECLPRYDLLFGPSLYCVGGYDWILRILAVLSVGRVDFHLSKVRVHATQTSR